MQCVLQDLRRTRKISHLLFRNMYGMIWYGMVWHGGGAGLQTLQFDGVIYENPLTMNEQKHKENLKALALYEVGE